MQHPKHGVNLENYSNGENGNGEHEWGKVKRSDYFSDFGAIKRETVYLTVQ